MPNDQRPAQAPALEAGAAPKGPALPAAQNPVMHAAQDPVLPALRALLGAMRPKQWAKNVFVFAGVIFAGRLFDGLALLRALGAFAVFCLAASSVYLANDVADRAQDLLHPVKRHRAIAAGRLAPHTALLASGLLAVLALGLSLLLGRASFALALAYLASSLAYSFALKRLFLFDVMIVASGFVLRAAAGAAAISAEISPWLLVCTFLLALFLALGKRRNELSVLGDAAQEHRPALGHYSLALVDSWLTALSGATIVCYALYTQSPRTVENFHTTSLVYTVPFVIYALFRYQALVVKDDLGGDPGALLAQDRGMWAALAGWALTAAFIIYR